MGTSLAYFLSSAAAQSSTTDNNNNVLLIEQEKKISLHTTSRNTGKVHAPFLYDPIRKKLFAKAAFLGFNMLKEYCSLKSLPFKQDGVLEVATYDKGIDRLYKYLEWGYSNGLQENELLLLENEKEVHNFEPNVKCLAGIYCSKDGSIDYGAVSRQIMEDAKNFGCKLVVGSKVTRIVEGNDNDNNSNNNNNNNNIIELYTKSNGVGRKKYTTNYLINAAGGNAVDVAHCMGVARDYTDLHFRGEYWQAPPEYRDLTKISIYTVPKHPQYPFLDPHWIVRIDGRREIGPNAVPVSSPYAYNWSTNLKYLIPKIFESAKAGTRKILLDKQFLLLSSNELKSSLSKTAMINRAREFLPQIRPSSFTQRGTAGIRSSLIDRNGKFVDDTLIIKKDNSLHVLNYNSPGATGALPMAAMIANELIDDGILYSSDRSNTDTSNKKSIWDIAAVSDKVRASRID